MVLSPVPQYYYLFFCKGYTIHQKYYHKDSDIFMKDCGDSKENIIWTGDTYLISSRDKVGVRKCPRRGTMRCIKDDYIINSPIWYQITPTSLESNVDVQNLMIYYPNKNWHKINYSGVHPKITPLILFSGTQQKQFLLCRNRTNF